MAMSNSSLLERSLRIRPAEHRLRVHPGWFSPATEDLDSEATPSADVLFDVFTQIIKIAGALDRGAAETLEDLNLTAGAFNALVELGKVGDAGVAPSELARRLGVARRTATLYVDILTKQGWAVREAHPVDRRMVLARLSEQGTHLLANDGVAYQRRLAELLGDLSPVQAERLRQLLCQIMVETAG
ncbi:N/A [soil metagenome]